MKARAFFSFLLSLVLVPVVASAETVGFSDLPRIVREKNKRVQGKSLEKEAQSLRQGYFRRSFLPEVNVQAAHESFRLGNGSALSQPTWKAEASVNVFRGGADRREEQIRETQVQLSEQERDLVYREELLLARQLFWQALYQQQIVRNIDEHLELTAKNLKEANRRITSGVATVTDRLEFQMRAELLRQELAQAKNTERTILRELSTALGFEGKPVALTGEFAHFHSWEKTIEPIKIEELPEFKLITSESKAMELERAKHTSTFLPKVDLYAGLAELNQREERDLSSAADRRETYVGVGASWSFGSLVEGRVERAALAKNIEANERKRAYLLEKGQNQQISRTEEIRTLHGLVHGAEENIERGRDYLNSTLREYARGVKNSPDVLEATEKLIEFKRKRAEIIREFNSAYAQQITLKGE